MSDVRHSHLLLNTLLIFLAVGAGFGGFYYYHTQTITELQAHYDQQLSGLATKLLSTEESLRYYISHESASLDTKIKTLDSNLNSTTKSVLSEIQTAREQTQSGLDQITGRLVQTEQKTQEQLDSLQSNIKNIKLSNKDFSALMPDVLPAVVSISVGYPGGARIGSGVFIDERGYAVTNHHVVNGATSINLKTADGAVYTARIVSSDSLADIAVISIDRPAPRALRFADYVSTAEKVIAIGSPLGFEFTVTEGIISKAEVTSGAVKLIQTDVAVNPGNSGGPILNIAGDIVGITTSKAADAQGIGFAVHADVASLLTAGMIQDDTA